jgi:hypothetical protein
MVSHLPAAPLRDRRRDVRWRLSLARSLYSAYFTESD